MNSNEIDILLAALAAGAADGFKETATTLVKLPFCSRTNVTVMPAINNFLPF